MSRLVVWLSICRALTGGPSWSVSPFCGQADGNIIADRREGYQMSSWGGQDRIGWRFHIPEEDGMKTFIGIDVSLASSAVCVLDEDGQVAKRAQIDSEPEAFIAFLRDLPLTIETIGPEAGPLSQWLHRGLGEAGFDLVLMETRQDKAVLKAMPVKTGRRDAEGIARLLRMGWFRPGHCRCPPRRCAPCSARARRSRRRHMPASSRCAASCAISG